MLPLGRRPPQLRIANLEGGHLRLRYKLADLPKVNIRDLA